MITTRSITTKTSSMLLQQNYSTFDGAPPNTSLSTLPSGDLAINYYALLLCVLPLFTVAGNCLVVIAVACFKNLRTVTNHMLLSLAIADLLIGLIVMPLNISNEVLRYWPYGQVMCHIWHSIDVLASTASILNLCIISLDRYWAVTNPIAYPRLMSKKRGLLCISIVWICSALISFPMIAWWHSVDHVIPKQCIFTEDVVYILMSSMISFYIPVLVMVVVYGKIFLVIKAQSREYSRGENRRSSQAYLRVHRGGTLIRNGSDASQGQSSESDYMMATCTLNPERKDKDKETHNDKKLFSDSSPPYGGKLIEPYKDSNGNDNRNLKRLIGHLRTAGSKKVVSSGTLSNEFKVARTLGVVLSLFLMCWMPFFVCNLLTAFTNCCLNKALILTIVTWLGHVNSGINPVIYALSMTNMKTAFFRIISCRCKEYYSDRRTHQRVLAIRACARMTTMLSDTQLAAEF